MPSQASHLAKGATHGFELFVLLCLIKNPIRRAVCPWTKRQAPLRTRGATRCAVLWSCGLLVSGAVALGLARASAFEDEKGVAGRHCHHVRGDGCAGGSRECGASLEVRHLSDQKVRETWDDDHWETTKTRLCGHDLLSGTLSLTSLRWGCMSTNHFPGFQGVPCLNTCLYVPLNGKGAESLKLRPVSGVQKNVLPFAVQDSRGLG